jgi:hypothetical protein
MIKRTITEMSVQNLHYMFVVTNNKLHQRHRLRVEWT